MVVRRPPNRKAQIVAAASKLFCSHGFHSVSVAQIAEAVDLTAPALYRHFTNKQALLESVVQEGLDLSVATAAQAEDLPALLEATAALAARNHGLPLLWQRESRYLPPAGLDLLRTQIKALAHRHAQLIRAARPTLRDDDDHLLAWAVISVNSSIATTRSPMPRAALTQMLTTLTTRAAHTELRDSPGKSAIPLIPVDVHLPRRERLLTEAARLFDERGYLAVSTDDIGAAAGTTGPNVYSHFEAKSDLLVTAITRGRERRRVSVTYAMDQAANPREALRGLLRAHIDFASAEPHLIGLLIGESDQLPPKFRRACEQNQRLYLDLWTQVLGGVVPGLSPAEASSTAWAALSVADVAVRIHSLRSRPDLPERLFEICAAILLGPDSGKFL